jgi:hypothetical protein
MLLISFLQRDISPTRRKHPAFLLTIQKAAILAAPRVGLDRSAPISGAALRCKGQV